MSANAPVPREERSPSLRTYLREYVNLVAQISAANPELAREHQNLFYFFAYAWLAEREASEVRVRPRATQAGVHADSASTETGCAANSLM